MNSAPKIDVEQFWQYLQTAESAQPLLQDFHTAEQWHFDQTFGGAPIPMAVSGESWMNNTTFMAQQIPCSVLMVPAVASQTDSYAYGLCTVWGPYPGAPATGYQHGDWPAVQPVSAVTMPQQIPSLVWGPEATVASAVPAHSFTLPITPPCALVSCGEHVAQDHTALYTPEFMPSTPEITPRRAPDLTPEANFMHCQHLLPNTFTQVAVRLAKHVDVIELPDDEQDGPLETPSERGDQIDDNDNICWDFDIHAALLIREKRDSTYSYASSDASTAVSRSSRHRRGRRHAKAKAASSMVILETPPKDELSVTEEKKANLIQHIEAGGDRTLEALFSLRGSALKMSLEPFGCRVLQSALDVANIAAKEILVCEFHGNVRLMVSSPHANFVIQKVIEVFPVHIASFVAEELATFAVDVAQHRFGCRVLSRLVEHHLGSNVAYPAANDIIDELLSAVDQLIRHNFARHVLELILEHGSEHHKQRIASAIRNNAFFYAKNRCASYVIEKALIFCSEPDKRAIASELLGEPEKFLTLAVHECGMHALKAVMRSQTEYALKGRQMLVADIDSVKSSKFGKRLLEDM